MAKKIIAVVGTYRKGHTIDNAVDEVLKSAKAAGAQTEKIYLIDKNIEYCTNCRICMETPGEKRGQCPIKDDMDGILDKIDAADGIILAAPVNCYNVTAVTRTFIERLAPYVYWPWGANMPKARIKTLTKKAVLITSSAAPAFFARLLYPGTLHVMKDAVKGMGYETIKKLFIGLSAKQKDQPLPEKHKKQLQTAGIMLAS
jgi:NAD(P)H-dependent FMN reductase